MRRRLSRIGAAMGLLTTGVVVFGGCLLAALIGTMYSLAHQWANTGLYAALTGTLGAVAVSLLYAGVRQAIGAEEQAREQLKDISAYAPRAYPGVDTNDC